MNLNIFLDLRKPGLVCFTKMLYMLVTDLEDIV